MTRVGTKAFRGPWVRTVAVAAALLASACSSPSSGQSGDGSGAGKAKLTARQLEDAYMAAFGPARTKDAFDAKLRDLKAKLGAPHEIKGSDQFWYGAGKAGSKPYCQQVRVMTAQKGAAMTQTDKSKCGL